MEGVSGTKFADTFIGSAAADTINGAGGADSITGNGGADLLTGGAGADKFFYLATTDSGPAPADADKISDFQHGSDKLDLSAIDADTSTGTNDAFLIGGSNPNVVAHSVTWFFDAPNHQTVVQVDVNGDTTADMTILLAGNINLTGDIVA